MGTEIQKFEDWARYNGLKIERCFGQPRYLFTETEMAYKAWIESNNNPAVVNTAKDWEHVCTLLDNLVPDWKCGGGSAGSRAAKAITNLAMKSQNTDGPSLNLTQTCCGNWRWCVKLKNGYETEAAYFLDFDKALGSMVSDGVQELKKEYGMTEK